MEIQDLNMMLVSCSGASNTGCYADRGARILAESRQADMICLPKIAINDQNLSKMLRTQTRKWL